MRPAQLALALSALHEGSHSIRNGRTEEGLRLIEHGAEYLKENSVNLIDALLIQLSDLRSERDLAASSNRLDEAFEINARVLQTKKAIVAAGHIPPSRGASDPQRAGEVK